MTSFMDFMNTKVLQMSAVETVMDKGEASVRGARLRPRNLSYVAQCISQCLFIIFQLKI